MNCTAFTYYVMLSNGHMHVCLIASSVKQACCCRVSIQVSQDGFSHVETYMHALGL